MKAIYNNFALGLMALAVFCVSFALTLANADEVRTLAIVDIIWRCMRSFLIVQRLK